MRERERERDDPSPFSPSPQTQLKGAESIFQRKKGKAVRSGCWDLLIFEDVIEFGCLG